MTEPVTLHMTLYQQTAGDASLEQSEFTYSGHRFTRGGTTFLSYEETDSEAASSPDNRTSTLLTLTRQEIIMSKKGAVRTKMTFRPGATVPCQYVTAAGTLSLEVRAKDVFYEDTRILLDYELLFQGDPLSQNRLEIHLTPALLA